MSAEDDLKRIERELDAKTASNGGQGKSGPPSPPSGKGKPTKRGADTPVAFIGILIAVAVLLPAAGRLTEDQRLALSSGAAGAAGGVAVGFVLGRKRHQ